jgi:hypothetical protein
MKKITPVNQLSRLALEWNPIQLTNNGKVIVDVFKCSLSATDGLPPYAQARIVDLISNRLFKARSRPCLWVSVDAPGSWYFNEIQRLVKRRIPTVILPAGQAPKDVWDFSPHGYPSLAENTPPPSLEHPFVTNKFGYKPSVIRVLRILARLKTAHKPEIASMAGFSETHIRTLLKKLQVENLVERMRIGKYDGWAIRNTGLSLAHRSWNIPKGVHFTKYRGEFRYAGERHRRVSRMWRSWLEVAYPSIEIWESWTEVPLFEGIPDALAWGHTGKREILFWLEVDSGHSSRRIMKRNYSCRLKNAYQHAKEWGIPIVFCIMGPPWVVEFFPYCIATYYPNLAVIGQDWRVFGELPLYEVGRWISGIEKRNNHRSERKLPFEPNQYPPKPKRERTSKMSKPKSTKPKYSKEFDDADGWHPSHCEREE